MTPFRLIAASRLLEVRTQRYVLSAERREGTWRARLAVTHGGGETPCLELMGIQYDGELQPFRRMYLVSASESTFEVRLDPEDRVRCHISGDAQGEELTIALCGDAREVEGGTSLRLWLRNAPVLPDHRTIGWPDCHAALATAFGTCRIDADTLAVASDGAVQPLSGHAPLSQGYRYAEMIFRVSAAP